MDEATDDILLKIANESDLFRKADLKDHLIEMINHLLLHDFNRLISILYRVDVNEQKLKSLLKENPNTDAAVLITDLLVQRQKEKLQTKKNFKSNSDIPDSEKW